MRDEVVHIMTFDRRPSKIADTNTNVDTTSQGMDCKDHNIRNGILEDQSSRTNISQTNQEEAKEEGDVARSLDSGDSPAAAKRRYKRQLQALQHLQRVEKMYRGQLPRVSSLE